MVVEEAVSGRAAARPYADVFEDGRAGGHRWAEQTPETGETQSASCARHHVPLWSSTHSSPSLEPQSDL